LKKSKGFPQARLDFFKNLWHTGFTTLGEINMYSDIIATKYSWCEDCERFHVLQLWQHNKNKRTTYTESDECYDHEPVSKKEVNKWIEDSEKSCEEYRKYVAETGDDHAKVFLVPVEKIVNQSWWVKFSKTIGWETRGLRLIALRRNGTRNVLCRPNEVPAHISEYLGMNKYGDCGYLLPDDLDECGVVPNKWKNISVEYKQPRTLEAIKRELKIAAKKSLT